MKDNALLPICHTDHHFDEGNTRAEHGTRLVMWITFATMVLEIVAGWSFNSMALLADGWHMSSHALAIGLSAFAYSAARRYAGDPRFAFGTWKIEVLASFASAIMLIGVALMMVFGSVERLLAPQAIHYKEAIAITVLGLVINLICAWILHRAGNHGHEHHHGHDHSNHDDAAHDHKHHDHGHATDEHKHHDLNLRGALLHVLADAATSVLAVLALVGGLIFGWSWLDPLIGIVGAVLVGTWSFGLMRDSSKVLLDSEMDNPVATTILDTLKAMPEFDTTSQVSDFHLWRVGRNKFACIIRINSGNTKLSHNVVHDALQNVQNIGHLTVEVHH